MIDDNRNNWRQLGVRKRTCFVGTAIISNWTAILGKWSASGVCWGERELK